MLDQEAPYITSPILHPEGFYACHAYLAMRFCCCACALQEYRDKLYSEILKRKRELYKRMKEKEAARAAAAAASERHHSSAGGHGSRASSGGGGVRRSSSNSAAGHSGHGSRR
jgi:hypothetical protein